MTKKVSPVDAHTLFQFDGMRDLVDAVFEVKEVLDDLDKVAAWFVTSNPNFGGARPITLFLLDRGPKVLKFIRSAREENWP